MWIPQAAVEETLREYGYKGRIEVVDNGNDFAGTPFLQSVRQEARRTLGIRSGEFMFLFVGQHIWEKNLGFCSIRLSVCLIYLFGCTLSVQAMQAMN